MVAASIPVIRMATRMTIRMRRSTFGRRLHHLEGHSKATRLDDQVRRAGRGFEPADRIAQSRHVQPHPFSPPARQNAAWRWDVLIRASPARLRVFLQRPGKLQYVLLFALLLVVFVPCVACFALSHRPAASSRTAVGAGACTDRAGGHRTEQTTDTSLTGCVSQIESARRVLRLAGA